MDMSTRDVDTVKAALKSLEEKGIGPKGVAAAIKDVTWRTVYRWRLNGKIQRPGDRERLFALAREHGITLTP